MQDPWGRRDTEKEAQIYDALDATPSGGKSLRSPQEAVIVCLTL
jgi:hypothetical protein